MNTIAQFAVICGLSLAAGSATWFIKGAPGTPVFICNPAKLRTDEICLADVAGKILWVDARSRKEWEDNGLGDSILWNLDP
ncbi:MAG: hypothetical protein H7Y36_06920, partial [Armatimonadetes bacterium]|nr:hypothetical protein [Akkermansiaceae bacterium]